MHDKPNALLDKFADIELSGWKEKAATQSATPHEKPLFFKQKFLNERPV